jgi:hypothetical protein
VAIDTDLFPDAWLEQALGEGGGGWSGRGDDDGDGDDGWGWSEDPFDDAAPYRRPRAVRVVALVAVAAIVLGSVGAWAAMVVTSASSVASVRDVTVRGTSGDRVVVVGFRVANPAVGAVLLRCDVEVGSAGRPLGRSSRQVVVTGPSVAVSAPVTLERSARTPVGVAVACAPAAS